MSRIEPSRRRFLQVTSALAVGATLPAVHVSGAEAINDEKLNLAVIGVGGRGNANLGGVSSQNIYALCDINPAAMASAKKRFPKAKTFTDWRNVMTDSAIDGVVISTADHHHALAAIAAMRENKHVYCEKPLAHTVKEARVMQDEYKSRRKTIATQMGTQIHATGNYRRVVELVQAGAIGPVTEAHVWCGRTINAVGEPNLPEQPIPEGFDWNVWLGPAEDRPYNTGYWKGGNLNWNRRWEFGNGVLGDMGSHLIDLPYWALGLDRPTSVSAEGPAVDDIACPPWQVITWDHPAREGNASWSKPTKVVWYHGPEGMKRRSDILQPLVGKDTTINEWFIGVAFVGENGVLVADYGKNVLSPSEKFADFKRPEATIPPSLGHHAEWIHAAKTGGESLCNFDYSGALIEHNLLGNVAYRAGKRLQWDAEQMQITNDKAANSLLTKTYRDGWGI
ncbi:MAG: Gfo/Idh/MocA family oxidoreductase [bacterium]|nr:Gfo/Idh/MocA family oxidoreductase [bacterium]